MKEIIETEFLYVKCKKLSTGDHYYKYTFHAPKRENLGHYKTPYMSVNLDHGDQYPSNEKLEKALMRMSWALDEANSVAMHWDESSPFPF